MEQFSSHERTLLDLFRINQEKSQFVSSAYGAELTNRETFVLIEIAYDASRSASEIARSLNLEKSLVTRSIVSLAERGYLRATQDLEDKRRKILTLTEKAQKAFVIHDHFNAQEKENRAARISIAEFVALQEFFTRLADGMKAGPAVLRPGEDPDLGPMRRIVYGTGVLGGDLCRSGYSTVDWQVLTALSNDSVTVRAIDLCERFKVLPNTMSVMLKRYERMKFLSRSSVKGDKRSVELSLTAAGKKALGQIENAIVKNCIAKGISGVPEEERQRIIGIFARFIGESLSEHRLALQNQSIERISSSEGRAEARAFLVRDLVRRNDYTHIPEIIFGAENLSFVMKKNGVVKGVAEFVKSSDVLTLINFAYIGELINDRAGEEFLLHCVEAACGELGAGEVNIPPFAVVARWCRAKDGVREGREGFLVPRYLESTAP